MNDTSMETKTTKQLARELGLLRKRKVCISPNTKDKKKSKIDQIFSYLIVLDFESTCWENDKTLSQEIIEFPAVLLNCNSGLIESTFHHYILPSEHPQLSEFCKKLTGISQSQVDGGIPLSFCLRKFYYWLKKLQTDKGIICVSDQHFSVAGGNQLTGKDKLAAFMTWSDWDLGVCLLNETKRKQVMKLSAFDRWIDLRATYRKFYDRRPDGLNGAMKDLGLQFQGREHSGIDDATNTARLAYRMMRDGCQFQITKSLKTNGTSLNDHKKTNAVTSLCSVMDVKASKSSSNKSCPSSSNTVKSNRVLSFKIMEDQQVCPDNSSEENRSFTKRGLSIRSTNMIDNVSSISSLPIKKSASVRSKVFVEPSVPNSSSSRSTSISPSNLTPSISNKSFNSIIKAPHSVSAPFKSPVSLQSCSSSSFKTPTNVSRPTFKVPITVSTRPSNNANRTLPVNAISSWKTQATTATSARLSNNTMNVSPLSTTFSSSSSSFKTPTTAPIKHFTNSKMKVTPPLCSCGRRSRRRLVQNPGPNEGRWFFSCTANNKSFGANSLSGCGFFKWEQSV